MCKTTLLKQEIQRYYQMITSFYYLTEIVFSVFGSIVNGVFYSTCGMIQCRICGNNHLVFSYA